MPMTASPPAGVPFIQPENPILPDLTGHTAAQIATARELHADNSEAFKMCNQIERTIIQQINTAIDPDASSTSSTMIFETYGAITPRTLTAAKAALKATTYNHFKPIVNIFTAINDYANMAEAAEATETQTQLINIGLIIITGSTIFSDADVKAIVNSEHDSTAGRTATASTAALNASPSRKATSTARPTKIGRTVATTTVTPAADGGGQH